MGCWGPDQPNKRDYAQETKDTLETQLKLAPDIFKAQQEYGPQYAALNLGIAQQSLPGILAMYQQASPVLSQVEREAQAARVGQEMGMVGQYAPQMADILRGASGNAELLRLMNQDATQGLAGGGYVDPWLQAATAQSARAAQAGRGMMTSGMPAINAEAVLGAQTANAIRNQNRAYAAQVVGLNQATGGDPFMALLGRPSQTIGALPGTAMAGNAYNPGELFNPESAYAGNIYNSNNAYDWQYKQATPSTMGKVGMVSDTIGSFIGKVGGGMFCSIAREAYGPWNPRWLLWRDWLITDAPSWLRNAYVNHQHTVALWLKHRPVAKRIVASLMDIVIQRRFA